MSKSNLWDYSGANILATGEVDTNNTNQKALLKYCAPFTNCITKRNNTKVENAKGTDFVRPQVRQVTMVPRMPKL